MCILKEDTTFTKVELVPKTTFRTTREIIGGVRLVTLLCHVSRRVILCQSFPKCSNGFTAAGKLFLLETKTIKKELYQKMQSLFTPIVKITVTYLYRI